MQRRFKQHQAGKASHYTKARGVRKIVYTERYRTKSSALIREAEIKRLTRFQKKQLIKATKCAQRIMGA